MSSSGLQKPDHLKYKDEKSLWTEHQASNGKTYYFNRKTQESKWVKPECLQTQEEKENESNWQEYKTQEGKTFYYNAKDKKSVWKMPLELREQREKQDKSSKKPDENVGKYGSEQRVKQQEELLRELQAKQFKDYMKEKNIDIQMKWDEGQKILNKDEKKWNTVKQISEKRKLFYEYIQDLKMQEKEERLNIKQTQRNDFFKMLEEQNLNSNSKWHKVIQNFARDPRFKAVEEREREAYFQDYLDDLYDQERDEKKKKTKENIQFIKKALDEIVKEDVDYTWDEFCKMFKDNQYFKELHKYDQISLFADYMTQLEEDITQKEIDNKRRQERINREEFRKFLKEKIQTNAIDHKTKFSQFVQQNQENKIFLNLLGQKGVTPHEYFLDEVIQLKQLHDDLKQEIKEYLRTSNEFKFTKDVRFGDFKKNLDANIDYFKKIGDEYKFFFYHLFMNKISGKNKIKDAQKKEKKLNKIRKRFFKIIKSLKVEVTSHTKFSEIQSQIDKLASSNPKIAKIKQEMREKLFEEYQQNILKSSKNSGSHHQEDQSRQNKNKNAVLDDDDDDDDDDSDSEDDNDVANKKRKNSRNYQDEVQKKVKHNSHHSNNNNGMEEEDGEVQEEREKHSNKHSKRDQKEKSKKRRKDSRSRSRR